MSASKVGVSIVLPVYNGARFLDACLAAIFAEADGRPMEVVVVEDGSTDRSPEILAGYAEAGRIRLFPGPHRGAAAAMNVGIRHARHPLICQNRLGM